MTFELTERFDDLSPEEVERRTVLFSVNFGEQYGRVMSDREFNGALTCWTQDYIKIDAMGNAILSEPFALVASVLDAMVQL